MKESKKSRVFLKRRYLNCYIQGFTDAEGCFSVSIEKQKTTRFGWVLDPVFQITQHRENSEVLDLIRETLGCGRIIQKPGQPDTMIYIVDNRRQLKEIVLPFFEKHKLLVKKGDFELFAQIVNGLEEKKHTRLESFKNLIKLAFQMNLKGKQRRYKLNYILEDLGKQDPQRLYAKHRKVMI